MTHREHLEAPSSSTHRPDKLSRRVVVTGIGVITPIGLSLDDYWASLLARKSGIKRIELFDASELPCRIAGEITGFDAKQYIDKKERKNLRVMARAIQMAVSAAQLAMNDAGAKSGGIDPLRFGVEFGSGLMASELDELIGAAEVSVDVNRSAVDLQRWGQDGIPRIPPLWMLKYLPNMLASHVSIIHDAQGPNNTITESDVASLLAMGEAFRILQRDQADFFLVGGADSKVNPLSMVRQNLFSPLSKQNDDPARASRPFDRYRDGLVIGEGATVLALEEVEHAKKRNAPIIAELAGFGASFDRERTGKGIARAIAAALQEAQITPDQLDHVNAHGLSTVSADNWEAKALSQALGSSFLTTPVLAPKSYFGNLGAASGVTEAVASLLALKHGQVPSSLNFEHPDPECPVAVLCEARPLQKPYFLKIGFTDIGQCAAAVFRRWDEL